MLVACLRPHVHKIALETMYDAHRAITRLLAALATAEQRLQDPDAVALLLRRQTEAAVVHVSLDYGSPGLLVSIPGQTAVSPWKVSFIQLLGVEESEIAERLITWVQTGKPPPHGF